ncbi:solute carrier family 2, facilitated glucose transporter member 6-like [Dermacentor variabilis]|uniref:solute carrier family 2, facilitated glucose transporter member 6-like n=1 Tax=Dermacentor variabilis TaxID=34621 RepID=UPI003F5C0496
MRGGEQPSEPYQRPLTLWFAVTVLSAWSGSFCVGITLGYTSPAADSLASSTGANANDLHTVAYSAWFGSLLPVGAVLGSVASASICQLMGRRFALLLSALIFMLGYVTLFAARWSMVFLFGRFLTGVATGMVSLCVPAYIAEITLPAYRGTVVYMPLSPSSKQALIHLFFFRLSTK